MGLKLITPPATEPVTLAEAKLHLRVDITDDDALITDIITAAREYVETTTRRQFVTATWEYRMDGFPSSGGDIELPRPPLASVSTVKYNDSDGNQQTLSTAEYDVNIDAVVGHVTPAYGKTWPEHRVETDSIQVQYVAGYGAASAVPSSIKSAIFLMIGHLYEHREAVVVGTTATTIPLALQSLIVSNAVWEAV